jgi:hypothetical protein
MKAFSKPKAIGNRRAVRKHLPHKRLTSLGKARRQTAAWHADNIFLPAVLHIYITPRKSDRQMQIFSSYFSTCE